MLEELWKVWPHNVWPGWCWAQWRAETKHAWHLLILVRSLRSRSTNSKYVWLECFTVWCHMIMNHNHWSILNKVTIDNQPVKIGSRPSDRCPPACLLSPVSCGLMVPCEPCGQELELRRQVYHKLEVILFAGCLRLCNQSPINPNKSKHWPMSRSQLSLIVG